MEIPGTFPGRFIDEHIKTDSGIEILLACAEVEIEHKKRKIERELKNQKLFDIVKNGGAPYEWMLKRIGHFGENKKGQ